MRVMHSSGGPFSERPYYPQKDIEEIATDELRRAELLPSSPEPIRVERFIEKRFGITPGYEDLPEGVLGYSRFGSGGVEEMMISRLLSEDSKISADRRVTTTLAHEAGHCLLHSHLFVLKGFSRSLFDEDHDVEPGKVLCRDALHEAGQKGTGRYDGRWWEHQANLVMGALLLPEGLVRQCMKPLLATNGTFEMVSLPADHREEAAHLLSEVFDVNPVVGRLRLKRLFPDDGGKQLTL